MHENNQIKKIKQRIINLTKYNEQLLDIRYELPLELTIFLENGRFQNKNCLILQ